MIFYMRVSPLCSLVDFRQVPIAVVTLRPVLLFLFFFNLSLQLVLHAFLFQQYHLLLIESLLFVDRDVAFSEQLRSSLRVDGRVDHA